MDTYRFIRKYHAKRHEKKRVIYKKRAWEDKSWGQVYQRLAMINRLNQCTVLNKRTMPYNGVAFLCEMNPVEAFNLLSDWVNIIKVRCSQMTDTYVQQTLTLELLPHARENSRFNWWNVDCGHQRIGKVRGLIDGSKLTIHSIYICPKFERDGFTSEVVATFKSKFETIIADKVRHSARGFWQKMGFEPAQDDEYEWRHNNNWRFCFALTNPDNTSIGGRKFEIENGIGWLTCGSEH